MFPKFQIPTRRCHWCLKRYTHYSKIPFLVQTLSKKREKNSKNQTKKSNEKKKKRNMGKNRKRGKIKKGEKSKKGGKGGKEEKKVQKYLKLKTCQNLIFDKN